MRETHVIDDLRLHRRLDVRRGLDDGGEDGRGHDIGDGVVQSLGLGVGLRVGLGVDTVDRRRLGGGEGLLDGLRAVRDDGGGPDTGGRDGLDGRVHLGTGDELGVRLKVGHRLGLGHRDGGRDSDGRGHGLTAKLSTRSTARRVVTHLGHGHRRRVAAVGGRASTVVVPSTTILVVDDNGLVAAEVGLGVLLVLRSQRHQIWFPRRKKSEGDEPKIRACRSHPTASSNRTHS